MAVDRKFLLLCAAEVLVVAVGDLFAALILQTIVLAAFLGDRRGYPAYAGAIVLFAAVLLASGRILLPLLGLTAALGGGFLALTLRDYRLARWARGEA
jgi:hypothetical protein